jgi:predicted nuclease of predicted toxin-antitoxin system
LKFLVDQDVYALTIQLLLRLGHDVVTAAERKLDRASDSDVLNSARDDERIVVTRDRDFGALVFAESQGWGVIYLRIVGTNMRAVHDELERVLALYDEPGLLRSFVVVGPGRHRIRHGPIE